MTRLICFLIGHRIEPGFWEPRPVGGWFRFWNCRRCGERAGTDVTHGFTKPLDTW